MERRKRGKHKKTKNINKKIVILIIIILMILFINILVIKKAMAIDEEKNTENIQNLEDVQNSESEQNVETKNSIIDIKKDNNEIDEKIEQIITETILQNNLNESNFEFFYYNIDTKQYYYYNENTFFTAASTIKVPIAMVYFDKIYSEEISENTKIQYTSDCYEAGTGLTSYIYSVGSYIPVSFLLEQAIVNSDNTAINMLIKNLEYKNCRVAIQKYSDQEVPENFYTSNVASAGYYIDVLTYLYNNSEKYNKLIEYMKKSSGGEYLKKYIDNYEIAHKYGSYNGYIHDYGIVYGEETYFLGIFTKNISNAEEFIANLSLKISNIININKEY